MIWLRLEELKKERRETTRRLQEIERQRQMITGVPPEAPAPIDLTNPVQLYFADDGDVVN